MDEVPTPLFRMHRPSYIGDESLARQGIDALADTTITLCHVHRKKRRPEKTGV